MKFREIKEKSKEELENLLDKEKVSLMNFRFNVEGGKVKDVKGARNSRKIIARILTLLNERKNNQTVNK